MGKGGEAGGRGSWKRTPGQCDVTLIARLKMATYTSLPPAAGRHAQQVRSGTALVPPLSFCLCASRARPRLHPSAYGFRGMQFGAGRYRCSMCAGPTMRSNTHTASHRTLHGLAAPRFSRPRRPVAHRPVVEPERQRPEPPVLPHHLLPVGESAHVVCLLALGLEDRAVAQHVAHGVLGGVPAARTVHTCHGEKSAHSVAVASECDARCEPWRRHHTSQPVAAISEAASAYKHATWSSPAQRARSTPRPPRWLPCSHQLAHICVSGRATEPRGSVVSTADRAMGQSGCTRGGGGGGPMDRAHGSVRPACRSIRVNASAYAAPAAV
jgi:hypothetical protein